MGEGREREGVGGKREKDGRREREKGQKKKKGVLPLLV